MEAANLGTILTVGGSVLVALIGGFFMLKARRTPAAPDEVPIQDVWQENRNLRADAKQDRTEITTLSDAFDALYAWVQRALQIWGMGDPPPFTDEERAAIQKVRNTPRLPESTGGNFLP